MISTRIYKLTLMMIFTICSFACSSDTDDVINPDPTEEDTNVEEVETDGEGDELSPKTTYDITNVLDQLTASDNMSYEIVGDYAYISADGVPNHKSPYFEGTEWHDELYEAKVGRVNPNRIATQNFEFRIPINPTEATSKVATSMGPMGISVNGIPFFNQYAAGFSALDNEIESFDKYAGHPANGGLYHYHIEPYYLTETLGSDALLGVLLDGFPVYGPLEGDDTMSSDDLDEYHGHFGATKEFPEGIYHYHVTADAPYINGDGFYGVPGTVSN